MPKVQARNVDDNVYENIVRSANRNERTIEGEVRFTLNAIYGEATVAKSKSEKWAKDVSERLNILISGLQEDKFFRLGEKFDPITFAMEIGEQDPTTILNAFEGIDTPSFKLLEAIAKHLQCSPHWLLTGEGPRFPFFELGNDYREMFKTYMNKETGELLAETEFNFIRIVGNNNHDGTLLLLIKSPNSYIGYYESCHFNFAQDGVGGTGRGNLESFLKFVKQYIGKGAIKSYLYRDVKGLSSNIRSHHPCAYLRDHRNLDTNPWLIDILDGVEPKGFQFTEKEVLNKLKKIKWGIYEDRLDLFK